MRIADMHPTERPRERLLARGAEALSDAELLAILLRSGYAGRGLSGVTRPPRWRPRRGRGGGLAIRASAPGQGSSEVAMRARGVAGVWPAASSTSGSCWYGSQTNQGRTRP